MRTPCMQVNRESSVYSIAANNSYFESVTRHTKNNTQTYTQGFTTLNQLAQWALSFDTMQFAFNGSLYTEVFLYHRLSVQPDSPSTFNIGGNDKHEHYAVIAWQRYLKKLTHIHIIIHIYMREV